MLAVAPEVVAELAERLVRDPRRDVAAYARQEVALLSDMDSTDREMATKLRGLLHDIPNGP